MFSAIKSVLIILLVSISMFSFGQFKKEELNLKMDSVPQEKHPKVGKFLLAIDSRQSIVAGSWVRLNGIRIGMELMERYRFGFGFYEMRNPLLVDEGDLSSTSLLTFKYNTLFTEYVFYKNFRWSASAIMSYGSGVARLVTTNVLTNSIEVKEATNIPVFGTYVGAFYFITPWLAPGVGVGYRNATSKNKQIHQSFSSPLYVIKLKIALGRLYQTLFKKEKIQAEKKAYLDKKRN